MTFRLIQGDCREMMRGLEEASIDAIVTDPPAGISFMGKDWDKDKGGRDHWVAWKQEVAAEALRVCKPGAYALVWALPRTSHWTATAWENAGWQVRDKLAHVFGSGFPKSHNLEGEWEGWGTALKPAMEDWWLLRKPLAEKTVAANVQAYGTGALNIDASRVPTDENLNGGAYSGGSKNRDDATSYYTGTNAGEYVQPAGRWPANLIHDGSDEVMEAFAAFGESKSSAGMRGLQHSGRHGGLADIGGNIKEGTNSLRGHSDSGTAARFFYCAKASKKDRDAGLPEGERSTHPTVKPTALMSFLCRLVTPPNGVILDPFCGSGSTGRGALLEGFSFIGIEQSAEYIAIAERRIADAERRAASVPEPEPDLLHLMAAE